ncbi:DUF4396 domain-containing protein [Mesorhizobium sp. B2-7-3]|uniref:DUF4396 domain-containing protein n=1 Tax=Mesorhizobium sp. B2-7-3 TaxID=2589907 RepID=UPI0011282D9A|nr:DUF4396 domain-containing protein [Mesorhizobium sp. B2-7-3]TPJ14387.1 DUF4396 domain-containing protein [Mesorhizobium sp. B2-7-3]
MIPEWLRWVAVLSLLAGILSSIWIATDEFRAPQDMWIMNLVWPVCALFGYGFVLFLYVHSGRPSSKGTVERRSGDAKNSGSHKTALSPTAIAKAALHCGAGCTVGDVIAETLALAFPTVLLWLGWKSLFAERTISVWILDYIFAFVLGIAFQYFTIKPMRQLSAKQGLLQALKADALSLTAWQVGMYGLMGVGQFLLFKPVFGTQLEANMPEFWFLMQLAMLAGFATSYPVNWWLLRKGIKELM